MSIIGVGVDLEAVDRFAAPGCSPELIARIFTEAEAGYCKSQAAPARHFAARFAAKEATVKALNSLIPGLLVTQVEVYKEEGQRAPKVRLINGAALPTGVRLHVSLSHTGTHATAFVVSEAV
jgi:phosphopantetheine--protein transferase-like protein